MDPERWRQIEGLYHAALERELGARQSFLEKACGDADLRREVESLLAREGASFGNLVDSTLTELAVGAQLGPYKIEGPIGAGGMGQVFKARDTRLGRAVAIKISHEKFSSRFEREARAISALNHPHICTLHDIGPNYLVMELVEGETLAARLKKGALSMEQVLQYGMQIADALAAAHAQGVVHRDLKPANIMITKAGVKVLDFGLALIEDDETLTMAGAVMGTPAYMAPEQREGKKVDARADIYALGLILRETATGKRSPEIPGLPSTFTHVVSRCLEADPADRWQSACDIKKELEWATGPALPPTNANSASRILWIIAGTATVASLMVSVFLLRREAPLDIGVSQFAASLGDLFKQRRQNPFDGARYTRVTDFEGTETDASISPDGKLISFLSDRDGQFDLWLTQVGTQNYTNLTQGKMNGFPRLDDRPVGFSNDSSHLWFHQIKSGGPPWVTMLIPAFGGTAQPFLNAVSLAWSPDGRRIVYHTWESGDPTFISDPDGTNQIELFRRDAGVHAHHPVWSPDGRYIYFSSGYPPDQMDIWRVQVGGGTPERITWHNSRVRCPALLDDQTLVYSATADDGLGSWLYVMRLTDRIARRATAGLEQYVSVTADELTANRSRRLVATLVNPTAGLWSVPITAGIGRESAVSRIPTPSAQAQGPRTWRDQIFYLAASGPSHSLWRRDHNGRATELWKASGGGLVAPPAISPDGELICFSFRRKDRAGLYVMNADGTNLRSLANSFQVRSAASWSPDGKWVTVSGDEGKGNRVFKVAIAGGPPVRLLDIESSWPVWSPDGKMIIYAGPNIGGARTVFAMTPAGEPLPFPQLSVIQKMDTYRFLPDGSSMIILQGLAPRHTFWLLDLASGQRRQLTDLQPGFDIQSFDVTPDGKQIVFDRIRANADVVLIELAQN